VPSELEILICPIDIEYPYLTNVGSSSSSNIWSIFLSFLPSLLPIDIIRLCHSYSIIESRLSGSPGFNIVELICLDVEYDFE
jgi:hypothetical protein